MVRNRPRPFVLAAAFAAAAMALVLSSNAATAQTVNLSTPGTYTGEFYQNAAIAAWTTSAQVTNFMATPVLTPPSASFANFLAATGPGVAAFTPVVVTPPFPIPPWMPNSATSSWIGPTSNGGSAGTALAPFVNTAGGFFAATSSPQGFLAYTETFTLNSLPVGTSGLQWTSDNQGVAIYLNGVGEGDTNSGDFTTFTPFTLNAGDFKIGLNTLTFVVFNEEFAPAHLSPSGIKIEGIITTVPEPGTMALAAVGALPVLGIALARRRRRTV